MARLTGDLVEAVEEVKVENGSGRGVGAEQVLGICDGGVHGAVKATRGSDAQLASRHEHACKDISKKESMNGGSNADPGNANANRTEFATIAIWIFVQGSKVSGAKRRSDGDGDRTARCDTDDTNESRATRKVHCAIFC